MKTIYYLGPKGTFSHIVATTHFPDDMYISCDSFADISKKLKNDSSAIGIFPIHNTIAGDVISALESLNTFAYTIVAEYKLLISLCLMAKGDISPSEITCVYSKDVALAQCKRFISQYDMTLIPVESTAAAAQLISQRSNVFEGCIGNYTLANEYNLKVIAKNIQDQKENWTLFYCVKAL